MKVLDFWRRELRGLIPKGFLRRDQGDALFVSDYPRFTEDSDQMTAALERAGYRVSVVEGVARIDVTEEKFAEGWRALPWPTVEPTEANWAVLSLEKRLSRVETPVEDQPLRELYGIMKRLDQGDVKGAAEELAALTAVCQREKRPLPGVGGKLLLCALMETEGEKNAC